MVSIKDILEIKKSRKWGW